MKRFLLLLGIAILVLTGCATTTRYIEILEPERVWYGGEVDFRVEPGDTLKILWSDTCLNGRGTCYEVKDIKTGKIGYVKKSRMEQRHRIYTEGK